MGISSGHTCVNEVLTSSNPGCEWWNKICQYMRMGQSDMYRVIAEQIFIICDLCCKSFSVCFNPKKLREGFKSFWKDIIYRRTLNVNSDQNYITYSSWEGISISS